ncbi:MAG: WD40 repeat domain-containing protein, partial [Deltaproteobacteria bacterium]|nr:WD40 repeat domain-containing protein [Deltaproteobacteria bacterium]
MDNKNQWDWNIGQREIADTNQWRGKFNWIEEPYVSPDGEKIATIVNLAEGEFSVCVNGQAWE